MKKKKKRVSPSAIKKVHERYKSFVIGLTSLIIIIAFVYFSISNYSKIKPIPNKITPPVQQTTEKGDITSEAASTIKPQENSVTYTVLYGDQLSTISEKIYGDESKWMLIAETNNIDDPDYIYEGQTLILPNAN